MDSKNPQPVNRVAAVGRGLGHEPVIESRQAGAPTLTLTPEESAIISLIRSNSYQDVLVQIQDSVVTSVEQTIKFKRKKGGGLIFGAKKVDRAVLTPHEVELIKLLREKPYQQVTIIVMDSEIKGFNQMVKFKKKD